MAIRRKLRVSVVQDVFAPGRVDENLARAADGMAAAAHEGAQLVVLPELFSQGYRVDHRIWHLAEPPDGRTTRWLRAKAAEHHVWVGGGHALCEGVDFYDVFTLCGPDGTVAGRVYKRNAEANVFRREERSRVLATPLGRLGIAICADNQFADLLEEYHRANVDLVLMPHAWPIPVRAGGLVKAEDVEVQRRHVVELPRLYASVLGVPAVFANQTGPFEGVPGVLGRILRPGQFAFPGLSQIVDAGGTPVVLLGGDARVITAEVTLPAERQWHVPASRNGWVLPGSAVARGVFIPLDIAVGRLSYALSRERQQAARDVGGSTYVQGEVRA